MKNTAKLVLLLTPFILSTSFAAKDTSTKGPVASSDIPAKREFPLNTDINPCQDFHGYVCSKVESSFKLREDRSNHMFSFSDSRERLLESKKKYMNEIGKKKNLDPRTEQIRDFYMACMNERASAVAEKKEVANTVKAVSALKDSASVMAFSNEKMPSSFGNFVYVWTGANLDDPHKYDAIMGADFMRLQDHKYYENADLVKDYENLLTEFFKTVYGSKLTTAQAQKKAEAVVAFEKDFIQTYPKAAVRRQRWSEKRVQTQGEFLKKYPNLKAEMIFKNFPATMLVNTPIPESLEFVNANLNKYPVEVWQDLYLLKNLDDVLDDGYKKYFTQNFDFEKKYFGGPVKRSDRQERCTKMSMNYFTKELDATLLEQLFPNFDEAQVQEMGQRIRESILRGLANNDWLSKDAKKQATEKIKTARLQLVKPHNDREWDFNLVGKYSETDKIANQHQFNELRWKKMLTEAQGPVNQDAWGMGPLTVNAYYSENENKFVVPIGILQYPFFDSKQAIYENLGAIGTVMGHELGHSIDDNGSKYDASGKLNPWMPMKDLNEFNKRSERLVEFFNKSGHDGRLTLGENVADLVGLTFSYSAAFPTTKPTKEEQQKFFVAYAKSWCAVTRPDYEKLMMKTDPHAMGWARINEQVKHQPAFAEAFSCKAGDAMNLPDKERVKIW
ncbi:MAG: M13 family metallopeptidase [Bdellovibrionales bacterium]|nr:M13 family metallopeptidase [Bdellovibrionales bacterium]